MSILSIDLSSKLLVQAPLMANRYKDTLKTYKSLC